MWIEKPYNKAKNIGLKISKICENALNEAIRRLEGGYSSKDPGILRKLYPDDAPSRTMVGLPGFEPGSREPESRSLNQTSRQPHKR
jgi:hypothetical protein